MEEHGKSTLVWKKTPKLNPPPSVKVEKKPKRKTLSIHVDEYNRWLKIKGKMTWTLVMRDARIAYEAVQSMRKQITRLNDTLQKIALDNAKLLAHGTSGVPLRSVPSTPKVFNKYSNSTQNFSSISKKTDTKSQLLAEIKELQNRTNDIKSILKPMNEEELGKFQLSHEELEKRWESKKDE